MDKCDQLDGSMVRFRSEFRMNQKLSKDEDFINTFKFILLLLFSLFSRRSKSFT